MSVRSFSRALLAVAALGVLLSCGASAHADGEDPRTPAVERAERRLFDGAPPVIPHASFGASCLQCHGDRGVEVEGVGFSPPNPHGATPGISAISRCRQCHVFREIESLWRESDFVGFRQDLRKGDRLWAGAPPVLPHPVFMRENCTACHDGPAAREEIRTPHPERVRCLQCHVERNATSTFP